MKPYVIIFSTITVDGKLASKSGFSELSCPYDKMRQHAIRAESDAIIVGANTVRIDNPKLTLKYVKGKDPIRVTLSSTLNFDPSYRIFEVPPPTIVYTSPAYNREVKEKLERKNVLIRILDNLSITNVLKDLYNNFNVKKVMIEGGGKLIWNCIKENCYDEIIITISPRIFGNGISFAEGEGFEGSDSPTLKLIDARICECKKEVVIRYSRA
ncbi:MAG: 2,5-diamino-6-(ribosylamino)-4(3H)-pyrimidinone 5'-phosphate reductase [Sulfolobaceae archaeon]